MIQISKDPKLSKKESKPIKLVANNDDLWNI